MILGLGFLDDEEVDDTALPALELDGLLAALIFLVPATLVLLAGLLAGLLLFPLFPRCDMAVVVEEVLAPVTAGASPAVMTTVVVEPMPAVTIVGEPRRSVWTE